MNKNKLLKLLDKYSMLYIIGAVMLHVRVDVGFGIIVATASVMTMEYLSDDRD